jgi:hypothetical protein
VEAFLAVLVCYLAIALLLWIRIQCLFHEPKDQLSAAGLCLLWLPLGIYTVFVFTK